MTRISFPLPVADISSFAKKLKTYLDQRATDGRSLPSHLELLNLLARAAGMRNFQSLKASAEGHIVPPDEALRPETAVLSAERHLADLPNETIDYNTLSPTARKALLQFDTVGRLVRLPNKLSVQQLAMWWMWTQFAGRRKYTEKEVNQVLNAHHTFGDQATLRRELVNMKLLGRKSDCSEYWKEPMRPNVDVQNFLRALRQSVAGAQSKSIVSTRPKRIEAIHATT
jgi:hypothetical protein